MTIQNEILRSHQEVEIADFYISREKIAEMFGVSEKTIAREIQDIKKVLPLSFDKKTKNGF